MELFTLGPVDVNGVPNYTQQDVVELARSLTGFRVAFRGAKRTTYVAPGSFDDGDKLLFEGTSFMAQGKLGVEAEDGTPFPPERNVIDILFEHRDSDGRPTIARFVSRKLWESFAYPNPDLVLVDELADVFVASNYVISDLLTAILTHDEFYSARARSAVVRDPVEFVRGTMVALGVRSNMKEVPGVLRDMGMELFNPPGVEGWNQGDTWLSSSRYLARLHFAQDIASSRTARDGYRFQPEKLLDRQSTTSSEIVEDLLRRLQVTVPLGTYQTLVTYLGNADLDDENWVEQKLRGLFVLLLSLPEFQVQ
jgi:uncharacterized protein (DUF1800 family)